VSVFPNIQGEQHKNSNLEKLKTLPRICMSYLHLRHPVLLVLSTMTVMSKQMNNKNQSE